MCSAGDRAGKAGPFKPYGAQVIQSQASDARHQVIEFAVFTAWFGLCYSPVI